MIKAPPMVVFSDLDGTLLDHHSYSFEPALPALGALRERGIPLVLASSKTLAELGSLRDALDNHDPAIAENGGHVLVPRGYFGGLAGEPPRPPGPDTQVALGIDYVAVREALSELRGDSRFRFVGFGDMDDADVAGATGLSLPDATLARTRMSSEPLLWRGDDDDLPAFRDALAAKGLRLTRGGRFFHAQAPVDKADGMRFVMARFAASCGAAPVSVAAGDGENDLDMLRAAKRAIVMPPADPARSPLLVPGPGTIVAPTPGPAGWAAAIQQILTDLDTES